jgi:hypothetical protein
MNDRKKKDYSYSHEGSSENAFKLSKDSKLKLQEFAPHHVTFSNRDWSIYTSKQDVTKVYLRGRKIVDGAQFDPSHRF